MKKFAFLMFAVFVSFSAYAGDCGEGGVCGVYSVTGAVERELCKNKQVGDACIKHPRGATSSECRYSGRKDADGNKIISCHALDCDEDNLLLLHKDDNDNIWYSWGACRTIDEVQAVCAKECECPKGQRCVVDIKDKNSPGVSSKLNFTGKAFFHEKACHCVPKEGNVDSNDDDSDDDEDIKQVDVKIEEAAGNDKNQQPQGGIKKDSDECYYINVSHVQCNGKTMTLIATADVSNLVGDSCDDNALKDKKADVDEKIKDEIAEWTKKQCKGEVASKKNGLDEKTREAIEEINNFFGKKTVWRTEKGKFNTARLVSDTTAGVVLGTVGGIVSGKIIKKKQLEKGFDVLQCTIGGQKMADYGDTFQVSFRR